MKILPPITPSKSSKNSGGLFSGLFNMANKAAKRIQRLKKFKVGMHSEEDGKMYVKISPKTDRRITCIDDMQNLPEKIENDALVTFLHFSDAYDVQPDANDKYGGVNF